jgi:type II secretory pathway pseudopilin PulG
MSGLRERLARARGRAAEEAGLTLIELLVAAAMSVVIVGATASMLISAVQSQPRISERAENISAARWVQERVTREIRNGVRVYHAEGSRVEFLARVRRTACGEGVQEDPGKPAIQCRVGYTCVDGACSRRETDLGVTSGPETAIVSGLSEDEVFSFEPPPPSPEATEEIAYVGVTLNIPNPEGKGDLTVSDGAALRTRGFAG